MGVVKWRVVERRSVKGTPTLYIYGPTGYIGALFFPDAAQCDAFRLDMEAGGDVEFHDGGAFNAVTS